MLADNAVIPVERTQVPTEWDELQDSVSRYYRRARPDLSSPRAVGEVIEAFADGLARQVANQHHAEQPVAGVERLE